MRFMIYLYGQANIILTVCNLGELTKLIKLKAKWKCDETKRNAAKRNAIKTKRNAKNPPKKTQKHQNATKRNETKLRVSNFFLGLCVFCHSFI